MKKKYRDQLLKTVFEELQDKDFDVRENALFQLGLMLERSNIGDTLADAGGIYEDNLSREMLRMTLSDDEQDQVIDQLSRLIAMYKDSRATAFWTLGKAKGVLAIVPLLSLIQAVGKQLNQEAAYQVCDALVRWLDERVEDNEEIVEQLKLQDPMPMLREWLNRSDDRLAGRADDVMDRWEDLNL